MLNDLRQDYWTPESYVTWVQGKRFNLIAPTPPREMPRGLEFGEMQYFNRKAAAFALFLAWNEARGLLFDGRLTRWLDSNASKNDIFHAATRLISSSPGNTARGEKQNNDILARILILLDPSGPLRYQSLAAYPSALGPALAYGMGRLLPEETQMFAQILESELAVYWLEQQSHAPPSEELTRQIQRLAPTLKNPEPGFGIERVLYDLNPGLACQSHLVRQYGVFSLEDLYYALDHAAAASAGGHGYMDRHIAAFIMSRLRLHATPRLPQIANLPKLESDPAMMQFALLLKGAQTLKLRPVTGLSVWVSAQLLPMLDRLHKSSLRDKTIAQLRETAGFGSLPLIAKLLLDSQLFQQDSDYFYKQKRIYQARRQRIRLLRDTHYLVMRSQLVGKRLAQCAAYLICLSMLYFSFKNFLHLS
jgi:hypothetical protein